MFLMVGLPGAGKTTRAHQLAKKHGALRLTPDEWMIALFGLREADGMRDVLEGRLLRVGLEALELGTNVVVDFGCWSRAERSAIRCLAQSVGASCHLVHLRVNHETQLERITHRQAMVPDETLPMSTADILHGRTLFEEPDTAELDGHDVGDPPPGWPGWPEWAAHRWPSLT